MECEPLFPYLLQEAWPAPPAAAWADGQQLSWPSYRKPKHMGRPKTTKQNRKSAEQGKHFQ